MNKTVLIFCQLLLCVVLNAQEIRGQLTDSATGRPVSGVSVYLSMTSTGATSGPAGEFSLAHIPKGKYQLVFSMTGYETLMIIVNTTVRTPFLDVRMREESHQLKELVLRAYERNGWYKWGKLFTQQLIGMSSQAAQCRLKNEKAVRFSYSPLRNELAAFADEPMILENRALGYKIIYDMDYFRYSLTSKILSFSGYSRYEQLTGNKGHQRRWGIEREQAFRGSLIHFMRSLYADAFGQELFEVAHVKKVDRAEKDRVRPVLKWILENQAELLASPHPTDEDMRLRDSVAYYQAILKHPGEFEAEFPQEINRKALTHDSAGHLMLKFPDVLRITYTGRQAPLEYERSGQPEASAGMRSRINLRSDTAIEVYPNGYYYPSSEIFSTGFWGWWEKLANMLPFD